MMRERRSILLVLIVALSLLLSGCEDAEVDIFVDLALDWAHEKGLVQCAPQGGDDPATCQVEPTTAMYRWLGGEGVDTVADQVSQVSSTVGAGIQLLGEAILEDEEDQLDPGAEAVLDTGLVARDIAQADALAQEGLESGDPAKIEEAIEIRPNDWAYQEQLWSYYAANRDDERMGEIALQSDELVVDQINATFEAKEIDAGDPRALTICQNTYLSQYRHREEALIYQFESDVDNPNSDFLESQIRLVRQKIDQLYQNVPANPCQQFFQ